MMCYRDMTFCPFFRDCKHRDECPRPLTAEVRIAAEKHGMPISQYIDKPDCHEEDTPAPAQCP